MRVMRMAAWMWITYLACMISIDVVIYANKLESAIILYHLSYIVLATLFLGLSYLSVSGKPASIVTSVMLILISVAPIMVVNVLDLRLPPAPLSNLEGMVLRQLPVLMIGLVLVAWHYRLTIVMLYTLFINVLELLLVVSLNRLDGDQLLSFAFVVIIRMTCFIVVGIFVNRLISYLRAQQDALKQANQQLVHYASTLETLTISRERNRMSRELHDTVVHTLSGLTVQLETTKAYVDVNSETVKQLLTQSLAATRSGLQETRRALKELRASPLEDLGFAMAVQDLLNKAVERGKFILNLSLPTPTVYIAPEVEQGIYRIIQEATENVVQHAQAQHLDVRLTATITALELLIQDDGIGFDLQAPHRQGHFGLHGMKERAELIGGSLTMTSIPNVGTTIRLHIDGASK